MKCRLLCQREKNLQRKMMMIKKNLKNLKKLKKLKVKQKLQVPNRHHQKVKKRVKFLLHLHHHPKPKLLNVSPVHLARKLLQDVQGAQGAQGVLSKLLLFLLGPKFVQELLLKQFLLSISPAEEASPCAASHLKEILSKQEDPDEDLFHREDPDLNQHSQEDPGKLPAQSL